MPSILFPFDVLYTTDLPKAVVAEALTARKTDGRREKRGATDDASCTVSSRTASISTTSAAASDGSSVGTGRSRKTAGNGRGIVVLPAIPALAVSAFCIANSRCRNFLKGVGAAGSADLVLVRNSCVMVHSLRSRVLDSFTSVELACPWHV